MATETDRLAPADFPLPLYRMDAATYSRLLESGSLDGLDVELQEGLLVDRDSRRADPIHRFDADMYERMVRTGALEGLPIELLDGLLVEVSPQSVEHALVIERLTSHLAMADASLRVQLPLEAARDSVPEPDLALVGPRRALALHHPRAALLVIEVAKTSHEKDLGRKADIYAKVPVPLYWLVDVPGRAIEVRSNPGRKGYGHCETYKQGMQVPAPVTGVSPLDVAVLFDGIRG